MPRKLNANEVAALLRRGEELLANGDLAAARLLLQRVAETKNAQAAFQLASTYDPAALKKFSNNSVAADPRSPSTGMSARGTGDHLTRQARSKRLQAGHRKVAVSQAGGI